MTFRVLLVAVMMVWAFAPSTAAATGCREWNRMSEASQRDRVERMIADAIASQRGRSYQVNRNAIGRCLEANADNMYWDFGDRCSNPSTAHKSAIRTRFKWYVWNCVN